MKKVELTHAEEGKLPAFGRKRVEDMSERNNITKNEQIKRNKRKATSKRNKRTQTNEHKQTKTNK